MPRLLTRRPLLAAAAALAATTAAAPSASAAVSITSSTTSTFIGQTVTLKVSSTIPGTITIRQLRADKVQGPGRCIAALPAFESYLGGKVQKTVPYPTADQVVSVKIAAGSLEYFGGDPLAGLFGSPNDPNRCDDYLTQFTRISAWQPAPAGGYDVAHKALTRVL